MEGHTTVTHTISKRFRAIALGVTTVLGAGAIALTMTGSASAAPLPFHPEGFILNASSIDPDGTVVAVGPVHGVGTGNFDPGPDVWSLAGPTGTVRVVHSALDPLTVDPATCTASLDQTVRWALVGRTGADRFSFGFGTAKVTERALLRHTRSGRCLVRSEPRAWDMLVIGTGEALNVHRVFAVPRLSPALTPVS